MHLLIRINVMLYEVSRAARNTEQAKITKWKIMVHRGIRTQHSMVSVYESTAYPLIKHHLKLL